MVHSNAVVEEQTINFLLSHSGEVHGILAQYSDVAQYAKDDTNEPVDDEEDSGTVNTVAASNDDDYDRGEYHNAVSKKKPARPCPFCRKLLSGLSRHLKIVHKDRNEIKKAVKVVFH